MTCSAENVECKWREKCLKRAAPYLFVPQESLRSGFDIKIKIATIRVNLLSCIFPVLESSPALLEFLDDFLAESPLLQFPVEVFDVEGRQLVIRHHVAVLPTLRINEAES